MTRAEFIKEAVKQLWGVPLNDECISQSEFSFKGCDGIECPKFIQKKMEACKYEKNFCNKCPHIDFWEKEV